MIVVPELLAAKEACLDMIGNSKPLREDFE